MSKLPYYSKVVTVKGLANEEYNGLKSKLGGYVVDHNRRTMYLQVPSTPSNKMGTKELAIQPANIYFKDVPILDESYKLIDITDRLGTVPLHEVAMSDRVDVARFLCEVHQASLDIPDVLGSTPRKMAFGVPGLLINATMETIRNYGIKTQDKSCVCHKCGKMTTDGVMLSRPRINSSAAVDVDKSIIVARSVKWPNGRATVVVVASTIPKESSYKIPKRPT